MRKLFLILSLVLLPGVFALGVLDAFSVIDPFVSGTFSVTVDGSNAPVWNQSISNVTVNQDSGATVVDSDLTLLGNGQCTDADNTTPTFSVASENTSAIDCSISITELSITPASGFTGNDSCIISCADALNSTNSTFTITVNAVAAEEEEAVSVGGGAGGGGGIFSGAIPDTGVPTFEVTPEVITIKLNRGQIATKTFTVSNFRNILRTFKLTLRGINSLAVVQNEISVDAQSSETVGINFYVSEGTRIGVYSGSIDVESETISIIVDVKARDTDSEIGLTLRDSKSAPTAAFVGQLDLRAVYPGQVLTPRIDLSSFFEKGFNVLNVEYRILNAENQVVYSETVETQISDSEFVKEITLPVDISPGRYVLSILIDEDNATGSASSTFDVLSRRALLDDFVIQLSIIILIISTIFLLYVHYRAKKHKPKSR
jgi:hypothetical protein